jgi:hypothetical protein
MRSIQPASLPRAVAGTYLIVQAKTGRGKVIGMDIRIGDQDARKVFLSCGWRIRRVSEFATHTGVIASGRKP